MKTAISTCIKDERLYLKEWLDWHFEKGFDHVYLYEDNGSEPHADIVSEYGDRVTLLPIDITKDELETREHRQMKTYLYTVHTYGHLYDWIAFIDVDEFIEFDDGYDLERLLTEHEDCDGVILSWLMYGANGHVKKPEGGVIESYPEASPEIDYYNALHGEMWMIKSIINMRRNPTFRNIHMVNGGVNMNGEHEVPALIFKKAWIRHYFTKSWEEWVTRIMKRGDLCNGNRRLKLFFICNPDLAHRRKELIRSVAHMLPAGNKSLWLDRDIIAGGNVERIKALNNEMAKRDIR